MKSNSPRKNKATPSVTAHNKNKKRQLKEAAAAKAREGQYAYTHPAAVALGEIWDGFDVPIESVDVFLFWAKKDGVWTEVPDGDLLDVVNAQTKRYLGRRRNKKTGAWEPEWRNVEISKEAIKKAEELAEKTGQPVELPGPTTCEKFEVQFSPHHLAYANKVMAKIRAAELEKGATENDANAAADLWAIGVIGRAVPKVNDYLEWRTGRRAFLTPLHTISGKWHLTPWTTYVGQDGHIQGLVQAGRGGRTIVGYESQLDAGYELPPERLELYKKKLATEKARAKRYADGRYVDVGLSAVLLQHMRDEMLARGEQDLWEEACAEYRAALVKAEPLKAELEAFKEARQAEYLDKVKDAAVRKRDVAIDGLQPTMQEALQEVLDDGQMRKLTAVYSLPKIAGLVIDQLVKVKQLVAWARESLQRLLEELASLFGATASTKVVDFVAPVVPAVEPVIVEPAPDRFGEIVEAGKLTDTVFWSSLAVCVAHGELSKDEVVAAFDAKGEAGVVTLCVEREIGRDAKMAAIASEPVAATLSRPTAQRDSGGQESTEAGEIGAVPIVEFDETPFDVSDPIEYISPEVSRNVVWLREQLISNLGFRNVDATKMGQMMAAGSLHKDDARQLLHESAAEHYGAVLDVLKANPGMGVTTAIGKTKRAG